MGTTLEISKLVAASWLKAYWERIPVSMKIYMTTAVVVLMVITSMGIFGFLSKAHLDQNIVSGDVQSKIAIYDEKIKTERENIDAARTALSQMDAQVNERLSRSTDDRGAERAVQIRRQQQAERARLQTDISRSQSAIARLNEERAPIAAEVRKVEAEVGPIKYIANFIYGDNPDANILEKAVTWVIIIIVIVFDPLAVILLLASQYSFQWFRQAKEEEEFDYMEQHFQEVADELNEVFAEEKPKEETVSNDPHPPGWMFDKTAEEKSIFEQHPYLNQPFSHFKNLTPVVHKPEPVVEEKTVEEILDEGLKTPTFQLIPELQEELKKTEWPTDPEKGDRCVMFVDDANRNFIFNGDVWIDADHSDPSAVNALDESKKKSTYMIKDQDQQITKTKE
jgi:hypothetical protein